MSLEVYSDKSVLHMFGPCPDASWRTSAVLNTRSYLGIGGLHQEWKSKQSKSSHWYSSPLTPTAEEMADLENVGLISLMG